MNINFNHLWEKHKKFLTQVAGGFAVFLILFYVAHSYQAGAADGRDQIYQENDALQVRANRLDGTHSRETQLKKVLGEKRDQLLASLSIVANARLTGPSEHSDTKFKKKKDEVYTSFADRADKAGVHRPPLKDISFHVDSELTDSEWDDRYVQLDMLQRFLTVAVDERVYSIESVDPGPVLAESIPANQELVLLRYPVVVKLQARFSQVLRMIEAFQREGEFLGVEIARMEPVEVPGQAGLNNVTLCLYGVHLDEPREETKRPGRTRFGGRPRR